MKIQAESDKKTTKLAIGGLFVILGAVLVLTWPRLFDYTLFKVSGEPQMRVNNL
jgi:hypothetical protein